MQNRIQTKQLLFHIKKEGGDEDTLYVPKISDNAIIETRTFNSDEALVEAMKVDIKEFERLAAEATLQGDLDTAKYYLKSAKNVKGHIKVIEN